MTTRRRWRWRYLGWLPALLVPFLAPEPPALLPFESLALLAVDHRPPPGEPAEPLPDGEPPAADAYPATHRPGALFRFVSLVTDRFVVRAEPELEEHARRLAASADRVLAELERFLGPAPGPPVDVRLVSNAGEMADVAPPGRPPPGWASGVTYADRSVVLLSLTRGEGGVFVPLPAVFRHELAHLVTDRVVRGRHLPRWFDEGLALYLAADDYAGRSETLLDAALRDRLLPLEKLEHGYPADPAQIPIAYAQSLDLVRHIADTYGQAALRHLLRRVGDDVPFRQAVLDVLGTSLADLERDWRQGIRIWYRWIPALVSGATLWALIAFLLAWAYFRQRRRRQALYDQWDREQARDEAEAALRVLPAGAARADGASRAVLPAAGLPSPDVAPPADAPSADAEDDLPSGGDGPAAPRRGDQVVFHDGRFHSLN